GGGGGLDRGAETGRMKEISVATRRRGTRGGLLSTKWASEKKAPAEPPPKASTSAAAILLPRQPLPSRASVTALQFIAGRSSGIHEAAESADCGLPFNR